MNPISTVIHVDKILTWLLAHPGWHDMSELVDAQIVNTYEWGYFYVGQLWTSGFLDVEEDDAPRFRANGKLPGQHR